MPGIHRRNLVGKRYGKLVVVSHYQNTSWNCQCDCGNTTRSSRTSLTSGAATSCGCARRGARHSEDKFWAKVLVKGDDECWEWAGGRSPRGYGNTRYEEHRQFAHRVAYMIHNKCSLADMEGLSVMHKCDNPPCCNPNHLRLGTHIENMRDMVDKGRAGKTPISMDAPHLTVFGRNLMHWRYMRGLSQKGLAEKVGTSTSMICYYEQKARSLGPRALDLLCKALDVTPDDLMVDRDGKANHQAILADQAERYGLVFPELTVRSNSVLVRFGIKGKEQAAQILPTKLSRLGNLANCGKNTINELWEWAGLDNPPTRQECMAIALLEFKGYTVTKGGDRPRTTLP